MLTIENMGLGDEAPLGAAWALDLTTGAWVLKTAGIENTQDLVFTPNPGIRADYASNPGARVDPVTGTIYLYYEFRTGSGPGEQLVGASADGLTFSPGEAAGNLHARLNPRAVLLPDGTWRKYLFDQSLGGLVSESSSDGLAFARDRGGSIWTS